jgi:hypothetical protein
MFRTAAGSSAAPHADHNPFLGSAVLHHHDKRVTEEQSRIKPERSERLWPAHQAADRRTGLKELISSSPFDLNRPIEGDVRFPTMARETWKDLNYGG